MTPEAIQAAIEAFTILEPEAQAGIAAIIHHFGKKNAAMKDAQANFDAALAAAQKGSEAPAPPAAS
jgi:hypothetical protein